MNPRNIANAWDEIVRLWQKDQTGYLVLLSFQELIRLATTVRPSNDSDAGRKESIDADALKKIMAKLSETIRDKFFGSSTGGPGGHVKDVLLTFTKGRPTFDEGYFFYGLLDCAAQLGRYVRPNDIPSELIATKESLLSLPCDPLFLWKAVSSGTVLILWAAISSLSLAHFYIRFNFTWPIVKNGRGLAKI